MVVGNQEHQKRKGRGGEKPRNGAGWHSPDGDYQVASGWRETQTTPLKKEYNHLLLIDWKKPKEKILLNNKYIGKDWKCSNIRAAADSIARLKKKWHADTLAQSWRWKPTVIAFPWRKVHQDQSYAVQWSMKIDTSAMFKLKKSTNLVEIVVLHTTNNS